MFLAGIQAKPGLDPRLKHSGVTNSGHVILVYQYPATKRVFVEHLKHRNRSITIVDTIQRYQIVFSQTAGLLETLEAKAFYR